MRYRAVLRAADWEAALVGSVIVHDVRDAQGSVRIPKGRTIDQEDVGHLQALEWRELHIAELGPEDVHEDDAGARLACAAAGDGVQVGERAAGHWPLTATRRGIVDVAIDRLRSVNACEGLSVYTLFHGHIVDIGESVARAKITPFAIPLEVLEPALAAASAAGGLVRVRPFRPTRVGAVVRQSLGARNPTMVDKFATALREKLGWLGAQLLPLAVVDEECDAIKAALETLLVRGAGVIVVAGTRAMDEVDPTFVALEQLRAERVRHGVPAHPGSLFWIARLQGIAVLGLPTCGLFSEATVFDLVLPRLLCGDQVGAAELAELGHGGFLTRDMSFRFPPYRPSQRRGELAD